MGDMEHTYLLLHHTLKTLQDRMGREEMCDLYDDELADLLRHFASLEKELQALRPVVTSQTSNWPTA
jgi:hypothetical protein